MKIRRNPDAAFTYEVERALRANNNFCPCRLEHIPENKCMCKEFREQTEPGLCHCGLYEKVPD